MNEADDNDEFTNLITEEQTENIHNETNEITKMSDSPYENALSLIGFGRFHYFLYFVCALANASDAIEVLCVSFVLPTAECDLHMTSSDKGLLSSMTFGGMMIGGYIWGTFSDIYGRKYMLMSALIFNAFFGILCGLSQTLWLLLLFRFMSGVGVGGSVPIVWSYFAEFMPKNIRGRMICLLASSWMVGNLGVILVAYIILNSPEFSIVLTSSIAINNWRLFMIACSIPSLITAFLIIFLPESPKFHLYNGQASVARKILKNIYSINHPIRTTLEIDQQSKIFEELNELRSMSIKENASDEDDDESLNEPMVSNVSSQRTNMSYLWSFFKETTKGAIKKTCELFKAPYTKNTCLVLFIYFGLCFGYYGLWMWLPELFKRMSVNGGSPCTSNSNIPVNSTSNSTCRIDDSVFFSSFISALSNLPGNIITVVYIDQFGRNKITVFSLLASGITVFGIPFVRTEFEGLVLTTIFGGINVFTFNSFGCTTTEVFPTRLRSTSLGIQFMSARLGAILANVLFGLAVDISCYIPLCTISVLLFTSGLMAFKLPESKKIDMG